MKKQFERNLIKYQLYCNRNIFTIPTINDDLPTKQQRNEFIQSNKIEVLENLNDEIDQIKERYRDIYQSHLTLLLECHENDFLIKDMRAALFDLRMELQTIVENKSMTLDESIRNIELQKNVLKQLSDRAIQLNSEIRKGINNSGNYLFKYYYYYFIINI